MRAVANALNDQAVQLSRLGGDVRVLAERQDAVRRELEGMRRDQRETPMRLLIRALTSGSIPARSLLIAPLVLALILGYAIGSGADPSTVFAWLSTSGVLK